MNSSQINLFSKRSDILTQFKNSCHFYSEMPPEMKKIRELDEKVDDFLGRIKCLANIPEEKTGLKKQLETNRSRERNYQNQRGKNIMIAE